MSEENYLTSQSSSDQRREEQRAKEQAARDAQRAKEQAARDAQRAKEEAARARNTRPTKSASERQAAKEAAKGYGIDTKGMSTREIKARVSEADAVQQKLEDDMAKFIEKTLTNFTTKKSGEVAPSDNPLSVTSRVSETVARPVSGSSNPASKSTRPPRIKFYCYYEGKAGYIDIFGDPAFQELE